MKTHALFGMIPTLTVILALALNGPAFCQSKITGTFSGTFGSPLPAVHHPGDIITFTVSFEGVDASRLTGAQLTFNLLPPRVPDNQAGFTTEIRASDSEKLSPGTFRVSGKIPETVATGSYRLDRVDTGYA